MFANDNNAPITTGFELRTFFEVSSELHGAIRDGYKQLAYLAAGELMGMWLYTKNPKIRVRCAKALYEQGWGEEMAGVAFKAAPIAAQA